MENGGVNFTMANAPDTVRVADVFLVGQSYCNS